MRLGLVLIFLISIPAWADSPNAAAERALRLAAQQVQKQLQSAHPDMQRIDVRPVTEITLRVPSDAHDFKTRIAPDLRLSRRVRVWLEFGQRGDVHASIPIWFEVHAYKAVAVLMRPLRRHEQVLEGDTAIQTVDVAGMRILTSAPSQFGTLRARRFLPAGRVLCEGDLEPVPPVVSGQTVQVKLVNGPIVIVRTGVAEQDGRVGEAIRVHNPNDSASYVAMVKGKQQVEVAIR